MILSAVFVQYRISTAWNSTLAKIDIRRSGPISISTDKKHTIYHGWSSWWNLIVIIAEGCFGVREARIWRVRGQIFTKKLRSCCERSGEHHLFPSPPLPLAATQSLSCMCHTRESAWIWRPIGGCQLLEYWVSSVNDRYHVLTSYFLNPKLLG